MGFSSGLRIKPAPSPPISMGVGQDWLPICRVEASHVSKVLQVLRLEFNRRCSLKTFEFDMDQKRVILSEFSAKYLEERELEAECHERL